MKLKLKYRYTVIRKLNRRSHLASRFWVEGEGIADLLWELGIPATTTLGGSKGYSKYGDYSADLKGVNLILCPDRDKPGIQYMADVAVDYPNAKWLYAP